MEQQTAAGRATTVGFVGLGAMGRPMARHLIAAGHRLRVHARRPEAAAELVALGAEFCAALPALALGCEFVCINVTNTEDVEQVLFGAGDDGGGLAAGMARGTVVLDFSTISPVATRELAARLARLGVEMLDCPVSGGARGAEDATLAIMVGGRAEVLERARPLLEVLGRTLVHIGEHGAGQVVKACNQIVQVVNIEGIAEAMLFASAQGVDLHKMLAALQGGMAASRMLDLMGPKMAARDFKAGIEARLHAKDYRLIEALLPQLGLQLPAVQAVAAQLTALEAAGMGRDDTSSLLRVLQEQQGRAAS